MQMNAPLNRQRENQYKHLYNFITTLYNTVKQVF